MLISKNLLVVLFLFITAQAFSQLKGPTFETALKTKKAKLICVANEIPGLAKRTADGTMNGALIEVMAAFQHYLVDVYQMEVQLTYELVVHNNFDIFLRTVQTADGGVFGLSNVSITEKRVQEFQVSVPFMKNRTVLITNSDSPDLFEIEKIGSTFKNLIPYSIIASNNLLHLNKIEAEQWSNMPKVRLLDSEEEVARWIARDKNAFGSIDVMFYLLLKQDGLQIKRHSAGDGEEDLFGIIMPKSCDWQPVFDAFLTDFRSTSEYRKIISEHLGKSALRLVQEF